MKSRIRRKTLRKLKKVNKELKDLKIMSRSFGKTETIYYKTTILIGKYLALNYKLQRYS